uniref:Uncharacterized protein n=1 Tax=Lepeophtheirus salmonis TaxID=72036 RepID=A0A0K2VA07_LEPSM
MNMCQIYKRWEVHTAHTYSDCTSTEGGAKTQ